MTIAPSRETRSRSRYWAVFIIAALAVQLLIFLAVRRPFLDIFHRSNTESPGASSPLASFPDAIVAITIEIEGDEPTPEQSNEHSTPRPPSVEDSPNRTGQGTSRIANIDILDITGEAQTPIPSEPSGRNAAVPPRPVEITWPNTKDLGHCLGLRISIDILVSKDGDVLDVTPVEGDFPRDCIDAALDAARRIKFTPGQMKGKPVEMSTRLRIDFRQKR